MAIISLTTSNSLASLSLIHGLTYPCQAVFLPTSNYWIYGSRVGSSFHRGINPSLGPTEIELELQLAQVPTIVTSQGPTYMIYLRHQGLALVLATVFHVDHSFMWTMGAKLELVLQLGWKILAVTSATSHSFHPSTCDHSIKVSLRHGVVPSRWSIRWLVARQGGNIIGLPNTIRNSSNKDYRVDSNSTRSLVDHPPSSANNPLPITPNNL